MMRFRYLLDPVFLCASMIFIINKLVLKPYTDNAFVHGQLADCLCIPIWVPVMLAGMRAIGLRRFDGPPRAHEIVIPLLMWSCAFEIVLPQTGVMGGVTTADPFDVLSYASGALAAMLGWRWRYRQLIDVDVSPGPDRIGLEKRKGESP